MTASDKPEESDSRPEEDADRSVVMTDAAQGSETETAGSAAGEGGADATEQAGAAADGTEAPPPWQRGAAADTSTSAGSTPSSGASPSGGTSSPADASTSADASATLEQPTVQTGGAAASGGAAAAGASAGSGAVHDQDTVRTQLPQDQQRSPVSFDTGAARDAGPRGAGTGGEATSSSSGSARRPSRGPRRASLQVKRVDPWSVLKLALVLSVAAFIVWMIAVAVLYGVLDGMGVWDNLNSGISDLTQTDNTLSEPLISAGSVFGVALIVGAINIVLVTALATVSAFIYNVAADFAGGLEVTLSERE